MEPSGQNESEKRSTRMQQKRKYVEERDEQKHQEWLQPRRVIGRNCMLVDKTCGKIQIKEEFVETKPSLESLAVAGQNFCTLTSSGCSNEEDFVVAVVKEEVDLEEQEDISEIIQEETGNNEFQTNVVSSKVDQVHHEVILLRTQLAEQNARMERLENLLAAKDLVQTELVACFKAVRDGNRYSGCDGGTFNKHRKQVSNVKLESDNAPVITVGDVELGQHQDISVKMNTFESETMHPDREGFKKQFDLLLEKIEEQKKLLEQKDARIKQLEENQLEAVTAKELQTEVTTTDAGAKVIHLAPQVVQIMWDKRENLGIKNTCFINMRMACIAWSQAVFNLCKGPLWKLRSEICLNLNKSCVKESIIQVTGIWDISTGKSFRPLEPSCLTVTNTVGWNESKFLLCEMLKNHGQNLRSYKHKSFMECSKHPDKYLELINYLLCMPNLEKLYLMMTSGDTPETIDMVKCGKQIPFPRLPNLKFIKAGHNLDYQFVEAVLMANDHITDLQLELDCQPFRTNCKIIQLLNLKRLYLTWRGKLTVSTLQYLEAPALETLTIPLQASAEVLTAVEKFGNTLQELRLNIKNPLKLPKMSQLRKLILFLLYPRLPYSQLVYLNQIPTAFCNLEHLDLKVFTGCCCNNARTCKYLVKRELDHRIHLRKELVSSLWVAMPTLKKVEISLKVAYKLIERYFVFIRELTTVDKA